MVTTLRTCQPGLRRFPPVFAIGAALILTIVTVRPAAADDDGTMARAAVAANFQVTARRLIKEFRTQSTYRVEISTGSTGALYAQIVNGAPFDLFLSADSTSPQRLVEKGFGIPQSRRTYARGRLVLWNGGHEGGRPDCLPILKTSGFNKLAIANPVTAPYGLAAKQTLETLSLWRAVERKLVRGGNIAQTYQFVLTGNAQFGFVALAQLNRAKPKSSECRWLVPEDYHAPIDQQLVLLRRARTNAAAVAFLDYLASDAAKTIIRAHGYHID